MNCSEPITAPLLIVKHHVAEGPGRILDWIDDSGLTAHVLEVDECLPVDDASYAGLVVLGGPVSANSDDCRLAQERQLLTLFRNAGKPVLGICLGAQLLAQSVGCQVKAMADAESGWSKIHIHNSSLMVPQWHHDEIIPNQAITVLGHSRACANQIFMADSKTLGMQFHPEWNEKTIAELHRHFPDCPLPIAQHNEDQNTLQRFLFRILDVWWSKKLSRKAVSLQLNAINKHLKKCAI